MRADVVMTAMLVRALSITILSSLVFTGVARAERSSDLDLCVKAMGQVVVHHRDATQVSFGRQRVLVGNADGDQGFICLLTSSRPARSVAAIAFGPGEIGSISEARRIDLSTGPHLLTVQRFRGGSNATRLDYVMYRFDAGKIRKVLWLHQLRELTIADYGLLESNVLTPAKSGLRVSQAQLLYSIRDGRRGHVFYRARRSFSLRYEPEFAVFVEGVALCTNDLMHEGKVWLKKGERVGYSFDPGIEEAGGVSIYLVRRDGETTELTDLTSLVFLQLDPRAPR